MAIIQVHHRTKLEFLLRRNGFQQWRIPTLIKCRALFISRKGSRILATKSNEVLLKGDSVIIMDPLPPNCKTILKTLKIDEYRDYVFSPGNTGFDLQMKNVMKTKPQTINLDDSMITSLADFIKALSNSSKITHPIKNIILVSHANPEGLLKLPIDMLAGDRITYEDLEQAEQSKKIALDSELLSPRPSSSGNKLAPFVHIRGCRIGTAVPYLKKLKAAINDKIQVTAPKHFHLPLQSTGKHPGWAESMLYSFALYRPQKAKNRTEIINSFIKLNLKLIDSKPVTAKLLDSWLPQRGYHKSGKTKLKTKVVNPIHGRKQFVHAEYRYKKRDLFNQEQSFALEKDPKTYDKRRQAVKSALEKVHSSYKSDHPYPQHVRYGYTSLDDFMKGWKWKFRYDSKTKTLYFSASRYEYTIVQPIVEPTTNRLYLNFYPLKKSDKPIIMLVKSDTKFFQTV